MNRSELYEHLARNKQLLEVAAVRFNSLTDGVDHPRVDTARDMLAASGVALTGAAGGISGWTRTWLGMSALAVASWAVAVVAGQVVGLSAGWTVTVTVVSGLALLWPVNMLNDALAGWANRRRTTRPASPSDIATPVDLDPAAEIITMLWGARDGLAVVMRRWSDAHRFGSVARSAEGFDWLRRHNRHLFGVSVADRCVCQVIDSIEIWRDSREPNP